MKKIFAAISFIFLFSQSLTAYASETSYNVKSGISYSQQWGLYIANIVENDGKITNIIIDRLANGKSSKKLHDNYGIKPVSSLNKDWWEQVAYYENWIVKHGIESVKTDEKGHALNPDLISGATINIAELSQAVKNAIDEKTEEGGYAIKTCTSYRRDWGIYIANVIFKDGKIFKILTYDLLPNGENAKEKYESCDVKNVTSLTYSDHEPLGNMRTAFLNDVFFKAVEEQSKGHIKINPKWNGEISISYDALKTVKDGSKAQITVIVPEYCMKELPLHQIFKSFPIGLTGQKQVNFFSGIYKEVPELLQEIENQGLHVIFTATGYPVAFFSSKPIPDLHAIKGQKWRSASFWHKDFLSNAGAIPVTMSWGQGVFDALNDGSLEGLMVNVDSGYDIKAHKAAPNILTSQKLWLGHEYIIAMNKDVWEKLSDDDKKAFERAAEISYSTLGGVMEAAYHEQLKILSSNGANVRILSDEEVKFWENTTDYRAIQNKWVQKQISEGLNSAATVLNKINDYMKNFKGLQ
ncbi:MAG: TRAP transporter substrate-binding protein DctP [Synergistaceae bacterium]|nr:TRAP transporter substrate-binding protein DctP [Synergistaceae bacterium]